MKRLRQFWFFIKMLILYIGYKFKQSRRKTKEKFTVNTIYGPITGVKRISCWKEPFYSFERIPFAKPPLNELRFRDPVPPDCWKNPLDCTKEAKQPRQCNILLKTIEGSEDCLYLNVYTNNLNPSKPRPVMAWFYGGGFITGTTSKDMYSPDYLMSEDVVFVSVAYRVGIFGFLSLKDPRLNIPGNAGLKDQIMSLKWVRENIASFGGNPNNVTVFGESAGGASTHYLMLTEQTKGLFHKAIMMSGSAFCPWALQPPNDWTYRLAHRLGFKGEMSDERVLDFFKKLKSKILLKHEAKLLTKEELRTRILFASGPVIEPYIGENCVIPKHPRLMARDAWSKDIPVIIGGNSFEGLFAYPDVVRRPWILEKLNDCEYLVPFELNLDYQSEKCRELGLRIKDYFFPDGKYRLHPYLHALSFKLFWHGLHRTALSRLHYANAPTYLYRFDFDSPTFNHVRNLCCGTNSKGVSHADDLSYMFYNALAEDLSKNSAEYKTIKRLLGLWTKFAKTGDPNSYDLGEMRWEPLKANDKHMKCLNISYNLTFDDLPEGNGFEVWNSLYDPEILF